MIFLFVFYSKHNLFRQRNEISVYNSETQYTQRGVLAITVDVINVLTWKYGERIILIITYISKSFKVAL